MADHIDIMATLCHERERALFLGTPVSSHIRMCKMIISDRFNMNNVDQFAEGAGTNDFRYFFAVGRISHDVSHSKNCTWFLNGVLHIDAIFYAGRHRFLAQNMIALLCERHGNLKMEVILHGDEDGVSQTLANGAYCFCGSSVEILPCIENKRLIHFVQFGKMFLRLGTWFGDGDDLAAFGIAQGIFSVRLSPLPTSNDSKGDSI